MRCRYRQLRSDSSLRCCRFIEPQASSRRFGQGGLRGDQRARAERQLTRPANRSCRPIAGIRPTRFTAAKHQQGQQPKHRHEDTEPDAVQPCQAVSLTRDRGCTALHLLSSSFFGLRGLRRAGKTAGVASSGVAVGAGLVFKPLHPCAGRARWLPAGRLRSRAAQRSGPRRLAWARTGP